MRFYDLADHSAIDVVDGGEVEDDVFFVAKDVLLDVTLDFLAIVAHGDAARQFEDYEAGLGATFGDFHADLFLQRKRICVTEPVSARGGKLLLQEACVKRK